MKKITLKTPIIAHDKECKELSMREPTGADIRACGMPMTFIALANNPNQQRIEINTAVISDYISRLCSIPPSSVDQLSIGDFGTLMETVNSFFGDARQI